MRQALIKAVTRRSTHSVSGHAAAAAATAAGTGQWSVSQMMG